MHDNYTTVFSRIQTKQQAESTDPSQSAVSMGSVGYIHALLSLLDNSVKQYSNIARNRQQKYVNQVYNHSDMPAPWFYSVFQSILKASRVLFPAFYEEITCWDNCFYCCSELLLLGNLILVILSCHQVLCGVVAILPRGTTQLTTDSGKRKLYFNTFSDVLR